MKPQYYFQAYDNYFWKWEDKEKAIAIPNSFTITFKEFIAETLGYIAHNGLPPFGALLLAIIATNSNGDSSIDTVYSIMRATLNNADDTVLAEAISFLKLLSEVPVDLKTGKNRVLLLQSIFKSCHNQLSIKVSRKVVEYFNNQEKSLKFEIEPFNLTNFHKDFQAIGLLHRKFNSVSAIINCTIKMPIVSEIMPKLTQEQPDTSISIVEQLINNMPTRLLGSLIKRLWASINIPFHHQVISHHSFGGFSDITNKGCIERLLISEFANENELFLTRLANNEALYYNRESPPSVNKYQRIILIDVSLKNWGIIKTLSFASMIAIVTHPNSKFVCQTFTVGDSYQAISIDTLQGVISSLSNLDPSLHSANGLNAFLNEFKIKEKEIIFISNQESLEFAEFNNVLSEHNNPIDYWVHPSANGSISVFKKQNKGKKLMNTFILPTDVEEGVEEYNSQSLFESSQYPLLFQEPNSFKKAVFSEEAGLLKITKEGVVFKPYDKHAAQNLKGWALLYENLPYNYDEYALGVAENRDIILLCFIAKYNLINLINLNTGNSIKIAFCYSHSSSYKNFFFDKNLFYFLHNNFYVTIDLNGKINKHEDFTKYLIKMYHDAESSLKREIGRKLQKRQIFKNMRCVFINDESELVFNELRVFYTAKCNIQISATSMTKKVYEARRLKGSLFSFADGSKVQMHRSGMIILKSSNAQLPVIFIPSVINWPLGVATNDFFAGNEYFFVSTKYEIKLEKIGNKKIEIIKTIKSYIGIGLLAVDKLVNECPCIIGSDFNNSKAHNLKKELEELGATVSIKSIGSKQGMIGTKEFYSNYLKPFIETIKKYGN